MKQYWSYFRYVVYHKWVVMRECFKRGLVWQGLVHDLSKFLPSEYIPYANHFYNKDGSKKEARGKTGYYKPTDTGDEKFDFAWLLHQKRNKHHWQWWVLPEDDGGVKVLPIPWEYRTEIICDWVGAGKAQGFLSPKNDPYLETRRWYHKNKDKMQLHEHTRQEIEKEIGYKGVN
jgi:hypothetical protein